MFDIFEVMGTPAPDPHRRRGHHRPQRQEERPGRLDGQLVTRARPVSSSSEQLIPVSEALASLLPGGGLRRGTVVTVGGKDGATTLALALLALASSSGCWCAVVGDNDLGVLAMSELGLDLGHVTVIPQPGPHWAEVVALLVDGVDVVLLRPPGRVRTGLARRIAARVRDRRAVLVVLTEDLGNLGNTDEGVGNLGNADEGVGNLGNADEGVDNLGNADEGVDNYRGRWPEGPDLRLNVRASSWHGVGVGHGHLEHRSVEVVVTGRRGAIRPVRAELRLPGRSGAVASG